MFDSVAFLTEAAARLGPSGMERPVSEYVAERFKEYAQDVRIDSFNSVWGRMGQGGPKALLCAHLDEVCMFVTNIDKNGFIQVFSRNGVDPRILPAHEVTVHGVKPLYGVCGAKPPHLQTVEERTMAIKMMEINVDVGLPVEKVRELVRVGDPVTLNSPLLQLQGDRVACKTLDDRACVAIELLTMDLLSKMKFGCEAWFVATAQEETGCKGAWIAANALRPDIAIALDVCHAPQPGAEPLSVCPYDKPAIAIGPNIHPKLYERAISVAKDHGIPYTVDVTAGPTGTDARSTQIAAGGVPTLLFELPLRYMHTSVETIDMQTLKRTAQWVAYFLQDLGGEEGVYWNF